MASSIIIGKTNLRSKDPSIQIWRFKKKQEVYLSTHRHGVGTIAAANVTDAQLAIQAPRPVLHATAAAGIAAPAETVPNTRPAPGAYY